MEELGFEPGRVAPESVLLGTMSSQGTHVMDWGLQGENSQRNLTVDMGRFGGSNFLLQKQPHLPSSRQDSQRK